MAGPIDGEKVQRVNVDSKRRPFGGVCNASKNGELQGGRETCSNEKGEHPMIGVASIVHRFAAVLAIFPISQNPLISLQTVLAKTSVVTTFESPPINFHSAEKL
jgi:hypothetical protein